MRLSHAFVRLPWQFDAARLTEACAVFGPNDWRAHPQGHAGNTALPLVAVQGDIHDDGVAGPMAPTPLLRRSPYLQELLAGLDVPIGRTRLMRLAPGADATPHVDIHYYWQQRVRIHIPVQTTPDVRFVCGDEQVHMAAGESWVFDTWRLHNVFNPGASERVHLVVDTVGSAAFWDVVAGRAAPAGLTPKTSTPLRFESTNVPAVMSPWELEALWSDWLSDACGAAQGPERALEINDQLQPLLREWRALWAQHGEQATGWPAYARLRDQLLAMGHAIAGQVTLPNGVDLGRLLRVGLVPVLCAAASKAPMGHLSAPPRVASPADTTPPEVPRREAGNVRTAMSTADRLRRPIIIVGAPRSGSTLLFETLSACLPVYTVQGESHQQIERFTALRPQSRHYASNRLQRADAQGLIAYALRQAFLDSLRDRQGQLANGADEVRWLEKTPKNALRVPFLDEVFPEACFVYLLREPRANVGSLIDGWLSQKFVMYPDLPGWQGLPWSFLLIEGWRELIGQPVAAIASAQWAQTNRTLLDDLAALPAQRVMALDYAAFVQHPQQHVNAIARFAGLSCDRPMPSVPAAPAVPFALPLSRHTLTPPAEGKWLRHADAMADFMPALQALEARARQFLQACRAHHAVGLNP